MCNEAERIESCLRALHEQVERPDAVVLLLNNCHDESEKIVRQIAGSLAFRLEVITRDLPDAQATAGYARRLAMAAAVAHAEPDGVLLTSDADSVVPPDWVARNLAALRHGADIVCGQAVIDPIEARLIPAHLHADDARECRLIGLLDEIAYLLDPEPHDPLPRHTEASGASLAVRVASFHQVGGVPGVASGEDRAFVRALWMVDARVRHDPTIKVTVSGRIVGRAEGGMADAIRRRMVQQDPFADDQVEPAADALRRYALRKRVRQAWGGTEDTELAGHLAVSRRTLLESLTQRWFGTAWARLEAASPVLRRRRVRFADLPAEIAAAEALLLSRLTPSDVLAAD